MGSNPSAGTKIVSSCEFRVSSYTRDAKLETRNTKLETVFGDEREMESGLIFNQLICEFESRHPCQTAGEC